MKMPIDVATMVSRDLSTMIERVADDPDREEVATLADVRDWLRRRTASAEIRDEFLHPQLCDSMLAELDLLIDDYGGEAPAADFVASKASEPMSRIIEVAMEDPAVNRKPTLGGVRDAMANGLVARLVGDGILEPDEDQTLMDEIEGLIERYGADALAEEFVRFE